MIKLYLLLSVVLFTSALNAQVSKSIELTPGTLSTILSRAELNIITNLTLGGTIDARDFKTMRDEMQKLAVVDLSTVNVSAYTGTEGPEGQSSTVYPADEIPAYAFSDFDKKAKNKNLISITLPLSVTSIGNNVFANAIELREVSIPLGLISIGDHSFDGCMILNLIHIPATVIHIGVDTFTGCGARIDVDANNPFYSSLDGVLFNKSRSFLIHYPISGIGSYDLPTSVTSVNPGAFQECTGLIPGTIPSSVSPFQYGIFQNSQGQSLIILSDLEFGIFQNCSQQSSVTVPVSVDSIGSYAFYGCTGLTAVTIPSSVHFIGSYAFQDCTNLTAINAMNSIPPDLSTVAEVFTDVDKRTCKLYVPYHSSALYAAASQWKDFTNSMEMPGFTLSASTATVSATEGSAGSVDISSNVAWSAVSDQTWLTVTPASGTGDGTLTYTASANSGPMRSALITVSADGTDPKVVTIIQAEGNQIQSIAFNAGWNIISSDVIPTNTDMKSIFQPLIDAGQLRKVMDESGKTIENFGAFGGWKNNIGNINPSKGYKVNVTASSNLPLVGIPVHLPLDIALNVGWNIISFPSTVDLDALALVQSLIDAGQLKKVMDERGKTIENFGAFGGWKNNIGNFMPGKGYKVNVTDNCVLTIPPHGTKSKVVIPDLISSEHFKRIYIGNGTDHMNIHLVHLQNSGLQSGDEIGIFDGGNCAGSAIINDDQLTDGYISIPASADDELGLTVNGFKEGHPVVVKLYRGGQIYSLNLEKQSGSELFEKDGSLFATIKNFDGAVIYRTDDPILFKCFPNPFLYEITIEIQDSKQTEITVEIYNIHGQRIKSLFKGINNGHLLLEWNGCNDSGQRVAPGVYVCKVNNQTRQVILQETYSPEQK